MKEIAITFIICTTVLVISYLIYIDGKDDCKHKWIERKEIIEGRGNNGGYKYRSVVLQCKLCGEQRVNKILLN